MIYQNILEEDKETILPSVPHQFETKMESLDKNLANPIIAMTPKTHQHIYTIIKNCGEDEISWLGSVKRDGNTYLIDNIFLFEQEVSFASTEIDSKGLGRFYADYSKKNGPSSIGLLNRILFWGHVHPNDTQPSFQDDQQMELFAHNKYFIRGIFNRGGRATFDFFDYITKIKILDCPWHIQHEIDPSFENLIKREIKNKVKAIKKNKIKKIYSSFNNSRFTDKFDYSFLINKHKS